MHGLPDIHTVEVRGKRVLVRASLNVPVQNGTVRNDFRLRQSLEVIQYLVHQGARVVVLGHIGRDPSETLRPVYESLIKTLPIQWSPETVGEKAETLTHALKDGEVLLLENVRRYTEETENSEEFAEALARLGDLYVNDAFADSHREHASIVGVPLFLPSYFGPAFMREYSELSRALNPDHPALFILGGAKFETKLPLIEKFLDRYDYVFVGGALANDILRAKGFEVGKSLLSAIDLSESDLLNSSKLMVPVDVVVSGPKGVRTTLVADVSSDERIVDVGPASLTALEPIINHAHMVLWNGPLGSYEEGFDAQTHQLAHLVADVSAHAILGGGDTVAAVEALKLTERYAFLSSAGGAMLTFLESGSLVGIDAVNASWAHE